MANFIGWLGSICFALCGLPEAVHCIKQGNAKGISLLFLLLWLGGEICYIISIAMQFGWVGWLMFNYFGNTIFVLIILWYYLFPRKNAK